MAQVIHGSLRKWLYVTSFLGSLAFMVILSWQGRALTTPDQSEACAHIRDWMPPIVAFELAGTGECADNFVSHWKEQKPHSLIETAKTQIWLDMPFTLFYPLFFALVCGSMAGLFTGWTKRIGGWISWAVAAACPLDLAENVALLQILNGAAGGSHAPFATTCALLKFSLLGLVVAYLLVAGIIYFVRPSLRLHSQ